MKSPVPSDMAAHVIPQIQEQTMTAKRALIAAYAVVAVVTLVFQLYVRSPACSAAGDCPTSYAKAVVWSAIWPASWVAYMKGLF